MPNINYIAEVIKKFDTKVRIKVYTKIFVSQSHCKIDWMAFKVLL